MKTIEERAKEAWFNYEYREGELCQNCFTDGFVAGAKSERKEMLQCDDQSETNYIIYRKEFRSAWGAFVKYLFCWHDPKRELPMTDDEVLVMVDADDHTYDVMKYDRHSWWQKAPGGGWGKAKHTPTKWRHIYEI